MEDAKPDHHNLPIDELLKSYEREEGQSAQESSTLKSELTDKAGSKDENGGGAAAVKLLQTMSLWLEGATCPDTDDTILTGWSARYAEQFDQEQEPQVDLAPLLGLPEGTDKEELVRVADEQEEDLLKQLIS
jgi:hypothetical protein